MKCNHCGAKISDKSKFCPECGQEVTPVEKKNESSMKLTFMVVGCILVLAIGLGLITSMMKKNSVPEETTAATESTATTAATVTETTAAVTVPVETTIPEDGDPNDVTCKGSYTADDETMTANAANVVATTGEYELTNSVLQVYYWMQFYNFVETYGNYLSYLGMDTEQPLDTQIAYGEETLTWQQYFLGGALDNWHLYTLLYHDAMENDFQISEDLAAYLDGLTDSMNQVAVENGFADAEEMLHYDMGAGCSLEDYRTYLEAYYTSSEYFSTFYDKFVPTAEQLEAYLMENEESYAQQGITKDLYHIDIRHILVCPVSGSESSEYTEEEWAACEAKANEILDKWLAGEKTETSFAELANEYSEDPGSNTTGGLYTDVYEGQMVQTFNDWCFDGARQVGDYGLVKTSYGYHIMYFVGSNSAWEQYVQEDYIDAQARAELEAMRENSPVTIDYASIYIGTPSDEE